MLNREDQIVLVVTLVTFVGYPVIVLFVFFYTSLRKLNDARIEKRRRERQIHGDKEDLELLNRSKYIHTVSRRARFEGILYGSQLGAYWGYYQIFITTVSCYAYVHELYEDPDVPDAFLWLELVLSISFVLDVLFNYYASVDKVRYLLGPFPALDWMAVVPFYIMWGYGDPFVENSEKDSLIFIRSLRLLRAFRAIRLYRLVPARTDADAFKIRLTQVLTAVVILVYVSVSTMQFLEDNLDPIKGQPSNAPFPWHTSFYYMIVSLTTVGYGDITPKTEAGRGVILIFLLWSVSLVPYFVSSLVSIFETMNRYDRTVYRPSSRHKHVVVIGEMSAEELRLFLAEWYHKDNNNQNTRIVIISPRTPDELYRSVLNCREFKALVKYIRGSPLDERVLTRRACVPQAAGCFLLVTHSHNAILTYYALKHANERLPIIIRVLDPVMQSHFPIQQNDAIFRPSELRGSLAATNLLLPGSASLITSLLSALSEDDIPHLPRDSWELEYATSLGNEFYILPTPPSLDGMSFADAAVVLYRHFQVILLAASVNVRDPNTGKRVKTILLNPQPPWTLSLGSLLYVTSSDGLFVEELFRDDELNPREILGNIGRQLVPEKEHRDRGFSIYRKQDAHLNRKNKELDDDEAGLKYFGDDSDDPTHEIEEEERRGMQLDEDPPTDYSLMDAFDNQTNRQISLYEHVVTGAVNTQWKDVYALLEDPRDIDQVVYRVDDFHKAAVASHIIFVGPPDSLLDLVAPLRFHGAPAIPIVVVVEQKSITSDIIKIAASFDDVFIVEGDGHDIHTLRMAGVEECSSLVITPEIASTYGESEEDPYFADADTIFTIRRVKNLFKELNRPPPVFHVELRFGSNLKFIERTPPLPKLERQTCTDHWKHLISSTAEKEITIHRLVSEGSVFFSDSITRILSNCYKSGGRITELVLLLLRQSRRPLSLLCSASLRLIDLPEEMEGESFADVFVGYAQKNPPEIIMGILRRRLLDEDEQRRREEETVGPEIQERTYEVCYAMSCPKEDTILQRDDRLYVLVNGDINYLQNHLDGGDI